VNRTSFVLWVGYTCATVWKSCHTDIQAIPITVFLCCLELVIELLTCQSHKSQVFIIIRVYFRKSLPKVVYTQDFGFVRSLVDLLCPKVGMLCQIGTRMIGMIWLKNIQNKPTKL
jgi:hypothetical protein